MPSEKEIKIIEKAALGDLRLIIKQGEKETYSAAEIMDLIDSIILAKDQE